MDHSEAQEHLVDVVGREADDATTRELVSHAESCADCSSWLGAYHLLSTALAAEARPAHPDSQTLALCAIRPEEVFEEDRTELRRHLESCPSCRDDVERLRVAVFDARPRETHRELPWFPTRSGRWKIALAAGVFAALVGTIIVGSGRLRVPHDGKRPDLVVSVAPPRSAEPREVAPVEHLSEPHIEGTRLIEARGALMISNTKISEGARVTIRAGSVVGFGDGFQIGSRARVAIGGRLEGSARQPGAVERGRG